MGETPAGPGRDWKPGKQAGQVLIGSLAPEVEPPDGWARLPWHTNPRAVWRTADKSPADQAVEVIGFSTGNLPLSPAPP